MSRSHPTGRDRIAPANWPMVLSLVGLFRLGQGNTVIFKLALALFLISLALGTYQGRLPSLLLSAASLTVLLLCFSGIALFKGGFVLYVFLLIYYVIHEKLIRRKTLTRMLRAGKLAVAKTEE